MAKYPFQSAYASFNNNPIYFTDPQGLEGGGFLKAIGNFFKKIGEKIKERKIRRKKERMARKAMKGKQIVDWENDPAGNRPIIHDLDGGFAYYDDAPHAKKNDYKKLPKFQERSKTRDSWGLFEEHFVGLPQKILEWIASAIGAAEGDGTNPHTVRQQTVPGVEIPQYKPIQEVVDDEEVMPAPQTDDTMLFFPDANGNPYQLLMVDPETGNVDSLDPRTEKWMKDTKEATKLYGGNKIVDKTVK